MNGLRKYEDAEALRKRTYEYIVGEARSWMTYIAINADGDPRKAVRFSSYPAIIRGMVQSANHMLGWMGGRPISSFDVMNKAAEDVFGRKYDEIDCDGSDD